MKSLLPSKEQIPLFMTLAAVLLLGLGYYYVYVPKHENRLREWKFRTLQNLDVNVREKISNGVAQLDTYLKHQSLSGPKLVSDSAISKINVGLRTLKTVNFPINAITPVTSYSPAKPAIVITEDRKIIITQTDSIKQESADSVAIQISLTYDFTSFIKPLLPDHVFDGYIVIGEAGVLYETFSSGLDNSSDSLIVRQELITSSTVRERQLAGIKYKLFIQPISYDNNSRLIVIGLLTSEHYDKEKAKLPPNLILILMLLFTGIVITFPVVKLYQLCNDDQLTTSDVLSCTVASMLLLSLLVFSFLKFSSIFSHQDRKDPKEVLADAISAKFLAEIKSYSEKLSQLDQLMAGRDTLFRRNISGVGSGQAKYSNDSTVDQKTHTAITNVVKDMPLNRVFWMDSAGKEQFTWKSNPVPVYFPGNFRNRLYFSKIKKRQAYDIGLGANGNMYVDQVISRISGRFLTDISMRSASPSLKVAAVSFDIQSLDSLKLPPGYLFAMIDEDGKVLYHSEKAKNLNENLYKEFSNPESLLSVIRTGSTDVFTTSYFGQEYNVRIKATGGGLPYFIVILDERSLTDLRDIDVYSFTFSMQVLLLVIVLIQMLIVFFASSRRSIFKAKLYDTSWLSPKKSVHKEYLIATGFYLWVFIAFIFFPSGSVICKLFMLLISITMQPVFFNMLLWQKYKDKRLPGTKQTETESQEAVKLQKTVKLEPNTNLQAKTKLHAAKMALILPVITTVTAIAVLRESLPIFLLFEVICLILPILLIPKTLKAMDSNSVRNWKLGHDSHFNFSFTAMVFSWMLVVNGLPIIIFFTATYNYDQHLIARYKQLELANAIINEANRKAGEMPKEPEKIQKSGYYLDEPFDSLTNSFYPDLLWATSAEVCERNAESVSADDSLDVRILNKFQVYESKKGVYNRALNFPRSLDFRFLFNNLMRQVGSQSDHTDTYVRLKNDTNYLRINSEHLNFESPKISNPGGAFCWFFLIAAMGGLFMLIFGMITKMFVLQLPEDDNWAEFDRDLLVNKHVFKHTFLVALPGAPDDGTAERSFLKNFTATKPIELDMSLIPGKNSKTESDNKWDTRLKEVLTNNYDLVIIDHFEYNFRDPHTSSVKLETLEKIMHRDNSSRVVIVSTIRPATLLGVMFEPDALDIDRHSIEKWHYLMGQFHIVIRKLIYTGAWETAGSGKADEESLTFKSQTAFYHYFFSIWQSLSKEEKFLLFDLAEDGLVNAVDKNTLCLLINKGVILREDGAMNLFSQGFRNFILTGIGHMETEKIMDKVNDNRNWNKIKIPLALISLAILAFILSSQEETSTKLITTLGAVAGVVPAIINFLATMGGAGSAKKA